MDSSSTGQVAETKRHNRSFMIRLVKEKPLGFVGAIITLLLLLTGIFANVLAPYGMNETHTADTLMAPSTQYLLGTDNLGRDMLSRIIFGARISMIVGLASAVIGTSMAVVLGMVSGYIGGKFDLVAQRFVDAMMCFPSLIFLMVLMSVIGSSMLNLIIARGI